MLYNNVTLDYYFITGDSTHVQRKWIWGFEMFNYMDITSPFAVTET